MSEQTCMGCGQTYQTEDTYSWMNTGNGEWVVFCEDCNYQYLDKWPEKSKRKDAK